MGKGGAKEDFRRNRLKIDSSVSAIYAYPVFVSVLIRSNDATECNNATRSLHLWFTFDVSRKRTVSYTDSSPSKSQIASSMPFDARGGSIVRADNASWEEKLGQLCRLKNAVLADTLTRRGVHPRARSRGNKRLEWTVRGYNSENAPEVLRAVRVDSPRTCTLPWCSSHRLG